MLISTEIASFQKYGDNKKILQELKKAGFTAYDATMCGYFEEILCADDYISKAKDFRAFADSLGLPCNQSHAPFPVIKVGDEEYNKKVFSEIIKAIEISAILGAKVCVVHPCNYYTAEENVKFFQSIEPYARKMGIKIGLENMFNVDRNAQTFRACAAACSNHEDFKKHLELLPDDMFVACLDVGHAEMTGLNTSAVEMIETLGNRLQALHLHDNDLIHDCHSLPFSMNINYQPIIEALKKSGYSGDITLETDFIKGFPLELYPQVMKLMADIAEYFRSQLDEYY